MSELKTLAELERHMTDLRYRVLLAAKGVGREGPGRVWRNRRETFVLWPNGRIDTVTSVGDWLEREGLLEQGPVRSLGGHMMVPTVHGRRYLDQ